MAYGELTDSDLQGLADDIRARGYLRTPHTENYHDPGLPGQPRDSKEVLNDL